MGKPDEGVVHLTFLLYPCDEDPGRVVAHCLELDVVAVEATKPKAILLLKELIEDLFNAALADGTMNKVFRPAPSEVWQLLLHAKPYHPSARVKARHIAWPPIKRVDYAVTAASSAVGV